ncbi:MAG: hypothetical protein JKX88_09675 [Marinicaulis sp.]|nr:hypothetical protein [Marinicaulis sp.]
MNILAVVGKVLELGRLLLQPVIDDHYSGEVVIEVIPTGRKAFAAKTDIFRLFRHY